MTSHSTTARSILALSLLGSLLSAPALAQQFPGTTSVNDCTFLNDPDQTRRCIESYQGTIQAPDANAPTNLPGLLPTTPPAATPRAPAPSAAPPPRLSAPPRLAPP